jgi:hypothetical protein
LLFLWYSVLTTDHRVARHTLALLPFVALIGAFVGGGMGLFIYLCEYALRRTTGVIARSLIGACYILVLGYFLGAFTLKTVLTFDGRTVDWGVSLILMGVMPAMYAGAFAKPSVLTINGNAIVTSPDSHNCG